RALLTRPADTGTPTGATDTDLVHGDLGPPQSLHHLRHTSRRCFPDGTPPATTRTTVVGGSTTPKPYCSIRQLCARNRRKVRSADRTSSPAREPFNASSAPPGRTRRSVMRANRSSGATARAVTLS